MIPTSFLIYYIAKNYHLSKKTVSIKDTIDVHLMRHHVRRRHFTQNDDSIAASPTDSDSSVLALSPRLLLLHGQEKRLRQLFFRRDPLGFSLPIGRFSDGRLGFISRSPEANAVALSMNAL